MQYIPWQNIADWHCKACGYCCKLYSVVLGLTEWLQLAKTFGARGVGIELREDLAKKALATIHENGLEDRVTIMNGSMFDVNLSSADVVYLYLTTSANEKIRPKLESDLKKGARVVSHDYEIIGWKPEKVENFCENPQLGYPSHTIYLYRKT